MEQIAFDFDKPEPPLADAVLAQAACPKPARRVNMMIADVSELVRCDHTLSDVRRRDLLSGLTRFATIAGRPLEIMPATATAVREVFASTNPQRVGLKKKSFQTLRSTVAFAVRAYGAIEVKQSGAVKRQWNAEWMDLVAQIDVAFRRHALSRFAAILLGPAYFTS